MEPTKHGVGGTESSGALVSVLARSKPFVCKTPVD